MLPRPLAPAHISVEVGAQPLPLAMRLASYRARPRRPSLPLPNRRLTRIISIMPILGVASMTLGLRWARRVG